MATKLYWTDADSGEVVTVIFDAVTTMTPEDTVDITEHPVEVGTDVTDHARSQAGRLTIEGVVSLTPNAELDTDVGTTNEDFGGYFRKAASEYKKIKLDIPSPPVQFSETGLINAGVAAIKGALFGGPQASVIDATSTVFSTITGQVLAQNAPRNRIRDVYEKLLKVKDDHSLITVLTLHRDHFDMLIERVAEPRTAEDGASAKFQIDLKQIRTVSSASIQAPKPSEPRAQKPKTGGSKNGKPDPNPTPHVSIAKQGVNALPNL